MFFSLVHNFRHYHYLAFFIKKYIYILFIYLIILSLLSIDAVANLLSPVLPNFSFIYLLYCRLFFIIIRVELY